MQFSYRQRIESSLFQWNLLDSIGHECLFVSLYLCVCVSVLSTHNCIHNLCNLVLMSAHFLAPMVILGRQSKVLLRSMIIRWI